MKKLNALLHLLRTWWNGEARPSPAFSDSASDFLDHVGRCADAAIAEQRTAGVAIPLTGEVQHFTAVAGTALRTGCIGTPGMPVATVPGWAHDCPYSTGQVLLPVGAKCTNCGATSGVEGRKP